MSRKYLRSAQVPLRGEVRRRVGFTWGGMEGEGGRGGGLQREGERKGKERVGPEEGWPSEFKRGQEIDRKIMR